MNSRLVGAIETGVGLIASALLAGAVGFTVHVVFRSTISDVVHRLEPVAAGGAAFLLAWIVIQVRPSAKTAFRVPLFDLREFEFENIQEPEARPELLLTDADRLDPSLAKASAEPLLLDDVLAQIGPESRVVRLFDRNSMPTPGQLQSRIANHIAKAGSASAPDASQALSDALAELRRSLRSH